MYLIVVIFPVLFSFSLLFVFHNFTVLCFIRSVITTLIIQLICCFFLIYEVIYLNSICYIELFKWFEIGSICINWSFIFDKTNVLVLFLVLCISLCVHLFAIRYLENDPHLARFIFLLYLFTICMQLLLTGATFLQLFLAWEGIGLLSFLLIGFWYTRFEAVSSSLMAIIYNRVGDCGLF